VVIVHQRIAATENGERRKRGQVADEACFALVQRTESITLGARDAGLQRSEPLACDGNARCDVLAQEPDGEPLQFVGEAALARAPMRFHAEGEVVNALLAAAELIAFADEDGFDAHAGQSSGRLHQAIAGGTLEALIEVVDAIGDVVKRGGHQLGSSGGRRRTQVGDKIGDGEVSLVADGGDDGKLGSGDGFGKKFGVEGCEVFERAAAASDDDKVGVAGAIEICNAGGDFGCSGFSLDKRGIDENVKARVATIDDVEKVADDGAGGRGDDADAVRECGERLFANGIEEAARFEALFELFEGDLQGAGADGLEEFGNELHLTALFVDGNFAAKQDVQAVGGTEAQERCLFAEEDDGKLCVAVFEREVDVAGGRGSKVGDFAFDPEVAVFALDVEAHFADEVADFPDAARDGRGGGGLERKA